MLEHHFGNHTECGKWCPTRRWKDQPSKLLLLVYRDKQVDFKLYEQLKNIRSPYFTDEAIAEINNNYNTNKCESMMYVISNFVQKGTHLCKTICYSGRAYFAVGHDSLGPVKYFKDLYKELGVCMSETMKQYTTISNKEREYSKEQKNDPSKRRQRAMVKSTAIRNNYSFVLSDKLKGMTYSTDQMFQKRVDRNDDLEVAVEPNSMYNRPPCKQCGHSDHQRCTSRKCTFYASKKVSSNPDDKILISTNKGKKYKI